MIYLLIILVIGLPLALDIWLSIMLYDDAFQVYTMNVLIGCEFSAVVRDAFIARGHDAWSCDLLDTEGRQGNHLKGDVRWAIEGRLDKFDAVDIRTGNKPIYKKWDMAIFHPECTFLCNSGVRWLIDRIGNRNYERWDKMIDAANFFRELFEADIPKIVVENPIMHKYAKEIIGIGQSQIIQPWQFGHGEIKATCLWLKGLPLLKPTCIVDGREARVHREQPGPERWKNRSRTLKGIAAAYAEQWG